MPLNYCNSLNHLYKSKTKVSASGIIMDCEVTIPYGVKGIIVFSQIRNRETGTESIKDVFLKNGFGTVTASLITEQEAADSLNFDNLFLLDIVSDRLVELTKWIYSNIIQEGLQIGYWSTGKGSAAALKAIKNLKGIVQTVVWAEGNFESLLETEYRSTVPILFLVSEMDSEIAEKNRIVYQKSFGEDKIIILKESFHFIFEKENRVLAAEAAIKWYKKWITKDEFELA